MNALLLSALLSASPDPHLAMGGFTYVEISTQLQRYVPEQLAHSLSQDGVRVITAADVAAQLGADRQRQLFGCGEEGSCIAELAGALGADGIVQGSLARVGGTLQLSVKVVAAAGDEVLAAHSERVDSDEQLLDAIDATAKALADSLLPKSRATRWIPLGAGGAAAAGGAVFLGLALDRHAQLTATRADNPLTLSQANAFASEGETYRAIGIAALCAGVATAAISLWLFRDSEAEPVVAVGPNGASIGVALVFW